MKAIAVRQPGLPATDPRALEALDLPPPGPPAGRDLLVRVRAVSVNPRDAKSRMALPASPEAPRILGYDAAGVVEAAGPGCTLFRPGDAVFYAGTLDRPGSNAELQLVDERIVGPKPARLSFAEAAALPLTALTAWEMLFDRLEIPAAATDTLLVVGGAGGVPSLAIPLARARTGATVVATASRPESAERVRALGAQHVVDHSRPLAAQMRALGGIPPVRWIFSTHTSAESWAEMAKIVAPQGRIGLIDDPEPLDLRPLKFKSASIHWEAMFTRPMFATPDMQRQHDILREVAAMVDAGALRPAPPRLLGPITAERLREAHALVEGGRMIGKLVLEGWG